MKSTVGDKKFPTHRQPASNCTPSNDSAQWYGILNKNGLREAYRAFLLLDEARHSVRCCEELGSVTWTAGLNGIIPVLNYHKSFFRGRILYSKERAKGYALAHLRPPLPGEVYSYRFDATRYVAR